MFVEMKQLLLPNLHNSLEALPCVVASNCWPVRSSKYEPAGLSFHSIACRLLGVYHDNTELENSASEKKDPTQNTSDQSKGRKKISLKGDQQDHYALLGIGHLRFLATEEQIRKAYRECALKYHPDKQSALILREKTEEARATKKEEIDQYFKAIQDAYEVLIDPCKRRVYDSSDEFDDKIPTNCSSEDFFKVFGPVFIRNGKWSTTQPVPTLGEEDTSMEEVDGFYNFWYSFKSWREFPHVDEFDIEEAEGREHKRWMERQNAKLREKAKKEEIIRVRALVDIAYKKDPRVLKRKEEEKNEKLQRKRLREDVRRVKEEEAARAIEQQRKEKEDLEKKNLEEAHLIRRLKEKEKKLLRKERSRFRTIISSVASQQNGLDICDDLIETICRTSQMPQLKFINDELEQCKQYEEQLQILQKISNDKIPAVVDTKHLQDLDHNEEDISDKTTNDASNIDVSKSCTKSHQKSSSREVKQKVIEQASWTAEEIILLRKAITKFPKGTSQRWEVISQYIGTERPVEDILRAVKTVLMQKPCTSKIYDSFLEKRKNTSLIIDSPLSTRDTSTIERSISQDHIFSNKTIDPPNSELRGLANKQSSMTTGTEVSSLESDLPITKSHVLHGTVLPESLGTSDEDFWSEAEQLALIKALKSFPKDTEQRWQKIAETITGKSKVQCFKKFAQLRENFKLKNKQQ